MIMIQEITPIKLSGTSSLLVSFGYNQKIVDLMPTFYPAIFHKSLLSWEVPIYHLSSLLDQLTVIDEISLKLKEPDYRNLDNFDLAALKNDFPWVSDFLGLVNKLN